MKGAIGGKADISTAQRFFVQGEQAWGDRQLKASRTRFIPKRLLMAGHCSSHGQPTAKAGYQYLHAGDLVIEPTGA
jgi:hypothetical protein